MARTAVRPHSAQQRRDLGSGRTCARERAGRPPRWFLACLASSDRARRAASAGSAPAHRGDGFELGRCLPLPLRAMAGEVRRLYRRRLRRELAGDQRRSLPWPTRTSRRVVAVALLSRERGVRNPRDLPPLQIGQVLRWADAHHKRLGQWPTNRSGRIADAPDETWKGISVALRFGRRGLPRGSSLAGLLAATRGFRNKARLPALRESLILRWADAHYKRTGQWPNRKSGPIKEAPGETWLGVENALRQGLRGLRGGSSLVQFLVERRAIRNPNRPPRLRIRQILAWADAFHRRTGRWPTKPSGHVDDAPDENWRAIDSALRAGIRGLPGGITLARLLAARRSARHSSDLPPLRLGQILGWADAFHARAGRWPRRHDGKIPARVAKVGTRLILPSAPASAGSRADRPSPCSSRKSGGCARWCICRR